MRRERRRRLALLALLLLAGYLVLRFRVFDSFLFRMLSRRSGLQADESQFILDGTPIRILGGSMHYFRVPEAQWKDRMLKMKACGLNTLTTYVPWNLHEPRRGKFDFSRNLDLGAFLETAADVGLWVILRPGPYICAEWDLGGLPSWLLRDKDMQLRTTYKGFADATEAYFDKLIPKVLYYQYTKGGPIIAVQVENEYGSYAMDSNYMEFIKTALVRRGIVELLLTSDNKDGISSGSMEGVLATINFQKIEPILFSYLDSIQSNKPVMVMEFWTGWFDHWGGDHHVFDVDQMISTVSDVLKKGASINLYMFHGGTNFGFMAGALHFHEYRADVTSYDYDAPLTEAGDYTTKYFRLRELLSEFHDEPLPPAPVLYPKATYGSVELKRCLSLWDVLEFTGEPFRSAEPVNMENLPVNDGNGQSYGYTLYEAVIYGGGRFHTRGNVRDRAQVFVSTQSVGSVDYKNQELTIPEVPGYRKLQILVENCGRVNYGNKLNDQRKGLVGDVFLRDIPLRNFKIYSLDMNNTFISSLDTFRWSQLLEEKKGPVFYQGSLHVRSAPQDTFLRMKGWKKGIVFINGRNLGRYWDIGPQETLYVPGSWILPGVNEVTIFEEYEAGPSLYTVETPFLGRTQYVD
ncbi:beta-galactosidase-1-like protein 2 [Spea bombifrons]|uniref:beta-galactosidase-1-like protein 2 n=1 Tax=Spea bombifrons TaxID=233779 RepID=UPI00234AB2AA|nr:beta-galactosidase-1-like protein 2 [Spea bombifrons]